MEDGENQLAGTRDVDRLTFTIGKFSAGDFFDDRVIFFLGRLINTIRVADPSQLATARPARRPVHPAAPARGQPRPLPTTSRLDHTHPDPTRPTSTVDPTGNISVVDPGCVVDRVHSRTPDRPQDPNQPQ